jgi:hypothetical protein
VGFLALRVLLAPFYALPRVDATYTSVDRTGKLKPNLVGGAELVVTQ